MLTIIRLALVFSLFSTSAVSIAQTSTLIKDGIQTNAILINGQASDLLTPPPPNSSGVSVVKFTTFSLARPLQIINVTDNTKVAAKIIVIETTQLNLKSMVEIIGEQADVLFVNKTANAAVTCTSCAFKNIARLTVAAGALSYDSAASPNQISLMGGASLNVNSLKADGVSAIELLAPRLSLAGEINTQLRANYSTDGSFLLSPSGPYVVGYGNINIYAGFNFNYKTLDLQAKLSSVGYGVELKGVVKTQAAKILSTNPINITGTVDTTSDIASSVSYKGSIVLVDESIKIATLVDKQNVYNNGNLFSDKSIQISSTGELINNGIISGDSISGNAKYKFTNRGKLNAREINVAAESLENNSIVNGSNVTMLTKYSMLNRFGGRISGAVVELVSTESYIRNGSQYPFKPANDSSVLLTADVESDIDLATLSINGMPFQGATKVTDLSAIIIGGTVSLKAKGNIENINPYFEYTLDPEKWRAGVSLNYQKSDQVQLIADRQLEMSSDLYIINSSAIIGVNDPNGHFYAVAPNIANERYTTEVVIQPFSRQSSTSTSTTTLTGFESLLVVYSPPGIMYSFAPTQFTFPTVSGGFINNTSYFEVLNKAAFIAGPFDAQGKVTSIGLALQDKFSGSSTVVNTSDKGCTSDFSYDPANGNTYEAQGRAYYNSCGSWASNSNVDLSGQTAEQMKGTLFSVKGSLNGNATDFYGTNHHVIEEIDSDLIAAEIARNTWTQQKSDTGTNQYGPYKIDYKLVATSKLSEDGKSIQMTRGITDLKVITGAVTGSQYGAPKEITDITNQAGTSSRSVIDYLKVQYEVLKKALMDLLAAFDSWLKS